MKKKITLHSKVRPGPKPKKTTKRKGRKAKTAKEAIARANDGVKRPGRPGTLTQDKYDILLRALEMGMSYRSAAPLVGVSMQTLMEWKFNYPDLEADCDAAKARGRETHITRLNRLAAQSRDKSVALSATKFWLKSRAKDEFGDSGKTNVTVNALITDNVSMLEEALARLDENGKKHHAVGVKTVEAEVSDVE